MTEGVIYSVTFYKMVQVGISKGLVSKVFIFVLFTNDASDVNKHFKELLLLIAV